MNAALRHSIGCRQDKKTFSGLPCDEGAWVNVENLMKYDHLWKDSSVLDGTDKADRKKIIERWKTLQRVIYTEFKNSHRVRAQVLALKATRGELRKIVRTDPQHRILTIINRNKLRLEIGDDEEEVWLWPLAIRAPMGHLKVPWADWRLSAHISPGVGHVLGEGFHRTHFDSMSRIFHEVCGLEKAVTESAHFWYRLLLGTEGPLTLSDSRTFLTSPSSSTWLRNRYRSMVPDCLQMVTSWSNRQFLFSAFDAKDPSDRGYYRMFVYGGQDQSVCSVEGARTIATINTFDDLIDNGEKTHGHQECTSDVPAPTTSTTTRWIEAISLLTMVHKPVNPGCRLCPACLSETPAVLSLCLSCKGYLISHGWRHRLRKSVTTETLDWQRPWNRGCEGPCEASMGTREGRTGCRRWWRAS